jgi:phosphatidylglycerol:prolipoprotein diacylglycerol transferase
MLQSIVFGGVQVYLYPVLVGIGVFTGMVIVCYRRSLYAVNPESLPGFTACMIFVGLVCADLLYRINTFGFTGMFSGTYESGVIFYGGLLGATVLMVLLCYRYKYSFAEWAGLFAPAIAFGHAFGRIGCWLGGCCFGIEWKHIPDMFPFLWADGLTRFPIQLVESLFLFGLGSFLILMEKRHRVGWTAYMYAMLYGIFRFLAEFVRGDIRGYFLGLNFLSLSQGISIILFGFGVLMWKYPGLFVFDLKNSEGRG